jgi:hypothetical protein
VAPRVARVRHLCALTVGQWLVDETEPWAEQKEATLPVGHLACPLRAWSPGPFLSSTHVPGPGLRAGNRSQGSQGTRKALGPSAGLVHPGPGLKCSLGSPGPSAEPLVSKRSCPGTHSSSQSDRPCHCALEGRGTAGRMGSMLLSVLRPGLMGVLISPPLTAQQPRESKQAVSPTHKGLPLPCTKQASSMWQGPRRAATHPHVPSPLPWGWHVTPTIATMAPIHFTSAQVNIPSRTWGRVRQQDCKFPGSLHLSSVLPSTINN